MWRAIKIQKFIFLNFLILICIKKNKMSLQQSDRRTQNENTRNERPSKIETLDASFSSTYKSFDLKLSREIERIESSLELIMHRQRRSLIATTLAAIKEIRINCQKDPDDIMEETTLPITIKELADSLEEFVNLPAHRETPSHARARTEAIETIFSQATPWLNQVLERMLTNDGESLVVRAKALSSIFERGDRLHQVQREIRQSLKDKKDNV